MTANSMISTILQRDPESLRDKIDVWRQLSDILAQRGMQLSSEEILQSFQLLASLRSKVPEHIRRTTAVSVARHGRFAPLVAFYAHDVASVAVAMLNNARLADADWLAMLPATGDIARSILAGRKDLSETVKRALIDLGAGSVALPSSREKQVTAQVSNIAIAPTSEEAAPVAAPIADTQFDAAALPPRDEGSTIHALKPKANGFGGIESFTHLLNEKAADTQVQGEVAAPAAVAIDAAMAETVVPEKPERPRSQISELVRRIDKFQSSRHQISEPLSPIEKNLAAISAAIRADAADAKPDDANSTISLSEEPRGGNGSDADVQQPIMARIDQFRFEAGSDGLIFWVDSIAPQSIIGLNIGEAASGHEPGADGVAAGAFRQRAEIINARMILAGSPQVAGEWRFSAEPIFEPQSGQFQGYSGLARRPLRRERPYGQVGQGRASDSIRQLIHELRSPLNAISGFSQIISGQIFGPVNASYRKMADNIIDDAMAIQAIIDDLHNATAQPATAIRKVVEADMIDIVDVINFVTKDLQLLAADQRVGLSVTEEGGPFLARGDKENARRMIGRFLTALIDVSEPDSLLTIQLHADMTRNDMMQLRVMRPCIIRTTDAQMLLDPHVSAKGSAPSADILALGFSLRLVGSLANAMGGRLEIAQNSLILHLPTAASGRPRDMHIFPQQGQKLG